MRKLLLSAASIAALNLIACSQAPTSTNLNSVDSTLTVQEAKEFLEKAEQEIVELSAFA